ncbi:hypothetical protein CJP72_09230 [Citrobacter sp. NCU1]|uniref:hypothetical protein n=1 Tax=Citrobacter sp. NCU1 TaxID=2026683 RepID=UPI001391B75F|nr:hypothetical protein [Citrobacter sp. NCU1]NDO80943.1 hypothetical protein [Citrobacter sp. NCU1]
MKRFNIGTPSETKIEAAPQSITPDMIKSVFRANASVMYIGDIYKGNPAFKDWSQRLTLGEKLPRGNFFEKRKEYALCLIRDKIRLKSLLFMFK